MDKNELDEWHENKPRPEAKKRTEDLARKSRTIPAPDGDPWRKSVQTSHQAFHSSLSPVVQEKADMTYPEELREWAKGSYPQEAGTELLLRGFGGRFAAPGNPWISRGTTPEGGSDGPWIDFAAIPEHASSGAYSGGERRFLLLAASFGEGVPVVLSDILSGLDRETVILALAAVSHAAGSHQHSGMSFHEDGRPKAFTHRPSLYPWPAEPLPTTT